MARCKRCNGGGGWNGWPGFTCYRCRGTGTEQPKVTRAPRRRWCAECGSWHLPTDPHWNGLYSSTCPSCGIGHQREACPSCGTPHPQLIALPLA